MLKVRHLLRSCFKTPPTNCLTALVRRAPVVVACVLWLGAIVTGMVLLEAYGKTPGPAANSPHHWPVASRLVRDQRRPTLIMFMHPHCPCSKASLGELALLTARCQDRVKTIVLFLQPDEFSAAWAQSDTWSDASRIPGVTVLFDPSGREARCFGAQTSGDTVLYSAEGDMLFHGGITISRGHSGDNPGRDALQALILGDSSSVTNTPAFGCPLFRCSINQLTRST